MKKTPPTLALLLILMSCRSGHTATETRCRNSETTQLTNGLRYLDFKDTVKYTITYERDSSGNATTATATQTRHATATEERHGTQTATAKDTATTEKTTQTRHQQTAKAKKKATKTKFIITNIATALVLFISGFIFGYLSNRCKALHKQYKYKHNLIN